MQCDEWKATCQKVMAQGLLSPAPCPVTAGAYTECSTTRISSNGRSRSNPLERSEHQTHWINPASLGFFRNNWLVLIYYSFEFEVTLQLSGRSSAQVIAGVKIKKTNSCTVVLIIFFTLDIFDPFFFCIDLFTFIFNFLVKNKATVKWKEWNIKHYKTMKEWQ